MTDGGYLSYDMMHSTLQTAHALVACVTLLTVHTESCTHHMQHLHAIGVRLLPTAS
jgi:hypothetical protein